MSTAFVTTACGSQGPASDPGAGTGPVTTRDVAGVGTVLADTSGRTLYFTDSDRADEIRCTADCLSLWIPAQAPGDSIDGGPVADLGVIARPEGIRQLAYQGKPLYTFKLDSSDKPASGHNASDSFGGVDFSWHAVVVTGQVQPTDDGTGSGGGGY